MGTVIRNVAFDCADPYTLSQFWAKVFDCEVDPEVEPGSEEVAIEPATGPRIYFQRVPEPKTIKNRAHICLEPEVLRDQEVERIQALGATIIGDHREEDGTGWVVMADPEGNEFCVVRSDAERAATA